MQDPDCLDRTPVRYVGNPDPGLGIAGMDHLPAANVDRHMVDGLAVAVEDQISRLCLRYLNGSSD